MDTPKRNGDGDCGKQQQSRTPMGSRVEDSPVFIYINNLSPMKPVKPVHIAQTIHSLSLPPVSSIFTTPHIATKESRFLTRSPLLSLPKPDFSDLCRSEITNTANLPDNPDSKLSQSLNETDINPTEECSTRPSTQPEPFHYDCGSPYHTNSPCHDINSDTKCVMGKTSSIDFAHEDLVEKIIDQSLPGFEIQSSDNDIGQPKEVQALDWETDTYVEEGDDLLFFNSSNLDASVGPFHSYIDHSSNIDLATSLSQSSNDNIPTTQEENSSLRYFHVNEKIDDKASENINNLFNDQGDIQQQRCMPRRCLTFDMAGVRRKSFGFREDSKTSSSLSHNSKQQTTSSTPGISRISLHLNSAKQTASSTPGIPRIGLHLNSVASIPLDRFVQDVLPSASQHSVNMSSSIISSGNMQNKLHNSMSAEKSQESDVQGLLIVQDCDTLPSDVGKSDDLSHSSPKNKKRRSETEGDSCRRCNCKKSKCLKLYCECFAAGVYCVEPCSCQGCLNKPEHKDTVLATRKQIESRNPLAFAPKVIRSSEPVLEIGEETNKTPASARHKRGCNCKKSSCLKKYCECYQGGAGCSISCRCEGCKNTFGRKDGTMPKGNLEAADSKGGTEQQTHCSEVEKIDNHHNATVNCNQQPIYENLPITPFQSCRSSIQHPFTSKGKPPRSSLAIGGSSSTTSKAIVKFEGPSTSYFHLLADNEIPKNLLSDGSPSSGVKVISPSKRRISPPLIEGVGGRVSPSRKGCRKFTLKSKSISSFPSLTCDSTDEYNLTKSSSPSTSTAFNSQHL